MLQMIKNRLKDQRGLTLIELLAVIVILGIVAAIAVPSILGVMDKSKEDAVESDAIQILNAAKLYVVSEGAPEGGSVPWTGELERYVDINITENAVATSAGSTDTGNDYINVTADVTTEEITIDGTIRKDGKTLTLNTASLSDIENTTWTEDAGVAGIE